MLLPSPWDTSLELLSEAGLPLSFGFSTPTALSVFCFSRACRGNHHAQNDIITAGIPMPMPTPRAMLFDWLLLVLGGVDALLSAVGVMRLDNDGKDDVEAVLDDVVEAATIAG
jgi:hypothetical protein